MQGGRYDGFPQVFLSGDKTKALAHLGRAKSLLSIVQNLRALAGVGVYQKAIRENGVEITARSFGEVNALYVHASADVPGGREENIYKYPVIISGYVQALARGMFASVDQEYLQRKRDEKAVRVTREFSAQGAVPTEEDLALTAAEERMYQYPTGYFALTAKTIDAYPDVVESSSTALHKSTVLAAEAWGKQEGNTGEAVVEGLRLDYGSYRFVSGTLYSGALSKCAQLVLGIHRDAVSALTSVPPFLAVDAGTEEAYLAATGMILPDGKYVLDVTGHQGFSPQYGYTWAESDGLVRGMSGWWLVRITTDKVYARRLPIFMGSEHPEFAEQYRTLGLEAVAKAIEYFGGLPTGEGFPSGAAFSKGLNDGWILDITPASMPFPAGGWESTHAYCAWSFSPDGSEAHNVGYEYVGDSYYFKWASIHFSFTSTAFGEQPRARVVPQRRAEVYTPPIGVTYIQALPLKVPFLVGDSTVMNLQVPTEDARETRPSRSKKVYDAVVWAGFVGDDLQTLSYYYNPLSDEETETLNGEPPEAPWTSPGAWEWGGRKGVASSAPMMYSSKWDIRRAMYETEWKNKRIQKKLYEYLYMSIDETGNALAYEWPIYSPAGFFYVENESVSRVTTTEFHTAVALYFDRSMYSGAVLDRVSKVDEIQHSIKRGYARGPWRAQGFICEAWIWFSWRLDCAGRENTVWRGIDPDSGRDLYLSRCGQKCEWVLGGPPQTDRRTMVVCTEDFGGTKDVVMPRPARCTDYSNIAPRLWHPDPDETGGRGFLRKQYPAEVETFGWLMSPDNSHGYTYHDFDPVEMESAMGSLSPDKDSGAFHTNKAARNCYGYQYCGFAKHLVEGPGYGKIGRLHAGDLAQGVPRMNIVFVGVLDDE